MSRICDLTGKCPKKGHSVSFSNRKTNRWFRPNLFTKRFFIPETGEWITLKVCSTALKTIDKHGIASVLNKFMKEGKI